MPVLRKLVRADAHRVGLEEQADAALAEEAVDLADDFVEAGNGAQRVERGAIGGMFPGANRDLRQDRAGAPRRQARGRRRDGVLL